MSIIFHEKSGEFHLTNGKISYIMEIMSLITVDLMISVILLRHIKNIKAAPPVIPRTGSAT